MLYSMTGFGKATIDNSEVSTTVSIKTVNSRFRETKINLPPYLYGCEEKILEIINRNIRRGRINVYVDVEINHTMDFFDLKLDSELVELYFSKLNSLVKDYDFTHTINISDILSLQDILKYKPKGDKVNLICSSAVDCAEKAVKKLIEFRLNEGNFINDDIIKRIMNIEKYLDIVDSNRENDKKQIYENTKTQLNKFFNNLKIPEDKILQEVALLAQKADYTEEIVKLKSLVKQFKTTIKKEPPIGSKLNYILQELLREVNTIASKTVMISNAENVILMKEEFERIREQVRNIE